MASLPCMSKVNLSRCDAAMFSPVSTPTSDEKLFWSRRLFAIPISRFSTSCRIDNFYAKES